MLWHNLAASKRFFDDFMLIENDRLFHLTYVTWVRLCYMVAVCCKVVFCNIEQQSALVDDVGCDAANEVTLSHHHQSSWDFLSAARSADFQRLCGSMEDKVGSIAIETVTDDAKQDAMAQFAHCLGHIRSSYERQIQFPSNKNRENWASATARLDTAPLNMSPTGPPTPQPDVNGTNFASDLGLDVPMHLQTESFEDAMWESLMHDFTTLPQQ